MSNEEIRKRQAILDNSKITEETEKEYNELTTREIINDYLYYGYGIKTFIDNDYECARNITYDRLKELFEEQRDYLGNCDL